MSLLGELKRRNVLRVATVYVVAAWLVVQVVATIAPAFGFGVDAVRITLIVLVITFVPVLIVSWVFEITPQGIRRETALELTRAADGRRGRRLDRVLSVLLVLALGYFAFDKFLLDPIRDRRELEAARVTERDSTRQNTEAGASIAILPFANLSSDPEQEYFSDGVSEEILNLLARVPGIRVISRTSAFSFKNRNVQVGDIARTLDVGYVLEGSVRRSGDRVRVTAQLIEAASDIHVWSQSYERTLGDVFAIQDDVARSVLPAISAELTGSAPTVPRTDATAYALFLQAQYFFLQRTAAGLDRAEEYVMSALDVDHLYAPAWTLLGSIYINQGYLGRRTREEAFLRAGEAIGRALGVAPDYPLAHSARAWVAMAFERDFTAAAEHFRNALTLAPNNSTILGNCAALAIELGRLDYALQLAEGTIRFDPVNSVGHGRRADALLRLGRYREAEQAARKALELSPGMSYAASSLALVQLLQEQPAVALETAQMIEDEPARQFVVALATYRQGKREASDEVLEAVQTRHAHDAAFYIAAAHARRGEIEEAFAWLNRAIEERQSVTGIRTEPLLGGLHGDPRWQQALERLGLADHQIANIAFPQ